MCRIAALDVFPPLLLDTGSTQASVCYFVLWGCRGLGFRDVQVCRGFGFAGLGLRVGAKWAEVWSRFSHAAESTRSFALRTSSAASPPQARLVQKIDEKSMADTVKADSAIITPVL